jgi:AmpD protein
MSNLQINNGWLESATQIPSPNFYELHDREVSLLVIHCISLPPGEYGGPYIDQLFTNSLDPAFHPYFEKIHQLKVASHLLIERNGTIKQYVSFDRCAHHAGTSKFKDQINCNNFSIGIELEGTENSLYTDTQYEGLIKITQTLMSVYPKLRTDRIVGHSDIAPERKADPGEGFDWSRYRRELA